VSVSMVIFPTSVTTGQL